MKTAASYAWDELVKDGNSSLIVRTQDGVEVWIQVVDGKTIVIFPFGNELQPLETVGVLMKGTVALPVERPSLEIPFYVKTGLKSS